MEGKLTGESGGVSGGRGGKSASLVKWLDCAAMGVVAIGVLLHGASTALVSLNDVQFFSSVD